MSPADPALRLRSIDWTALEGLGPDVCAAAAPMLAGQSAERALDRFLRDRKRLTSPQRTAAVEALFGLALWRRRLAAQLGLGWTDETASVTLSLHAPALLGALLRDLAGLPESRAQALSGCAALPPPREPASPAELFSLPDWLWLQLARELPSAEAAPFAAAIDLPGPIFLRANRLRATRDELRKSLRHDGIDSEFCHFARDGLRVLSARPNLLASQASRAGLFEVQDEGSQLLGELLEAQPGETVLDLCAGAGGKSLQLAAQVGLGGRALCTDVDRGRLGRLEQRARRAGATCIDVLGEPGQLPSTLLADRVLVDAPCSELGTLRRGPDARFRIDRPAMATLPALQLELLEVAARHVHPGGRLVYATCTVSHAENEAVALAFEQAHPSFARVHPLRGDLDRTPAAPREPDARTLDDSFFRAGFFACLPHLHGTDGFFAATWARAN